MNITIVKRSEESPAMSRSRIVIALSTGITSLSLAGAASAEGRGKTRPGQFMSSRTSRPQIPYWFTDETRTET